MSRISSNVCDASATGASMLTGRFGARRGCRTIKSELETLIWGCLSYGEWNPNTGALIWQREINYEWTMYPGWPSVQNKFRTIPTAGIPEWHGYFSTWKQNGIWEPSQLAITGFRNYGSTTTSGWVVGGITSTGSHSAALTDVSIVDLQKGFDEYFGGELFSHRFYCNSTAKRCYFPNGKEAGL